MKLGIIARTDENQEYKFDFNLIKQSGFKYIDYQYLSDDTHFVYHLNDEDFKNYFTALKKKCDEEGIIIHQLHSVWVLNMFRLDEEKVLFSYTIDKFIQSIKAASLLGCKYVVIHSRVPYIWDELEKRNDECREINIKFIKALLPYAHQYNVYLCLENLPFIWRYTQFLDCYNQVKEINDDHLGICLDTGHFNMFNNGYSPYEAVKLMGDKLFALHCHDNYQDKDAHNFIYDGNFDWKGFVQGLKEIHFQGVFSLETSSRKESFDERVKENKNLYEIVNKLVNE